MRSAGSVAPSDLFRIGVDVGGTFTDLAVQCPGEELVLHKVLSTADPAEGLLAGLDQVAARLGLDRRALLGRTAVFVYGTTVATNAILTRAGAPTALLTNRGLRDALQMRGGTREDPFDNWSHPPEPLVRRHDRLGLRGRLDVRGAVLDALEEQDVHAAVVGLGAHVEAVAICLMHSHANPAHERAVADVVRRVRGPDTFVSVSCELLPQLGFEDRLNTTAVNAYVGPAMRTHLGEVGRRLTEAGLQEQWVVMQSNGGTVVPAVAAARPVVTVLSGPAAAPVVGAFLARELGAPACISVDMGGTSFDIALILDGAPMMSSGGRVGDVSVAVPLLDIHTIGAGGGSIGWRDERGILRMGPASAGSRPGPAAYGRGGMRPTCTDANVVLGYLDRESFRTGGIELDPVAAAAAIERDLAGPLGLSVEQAAAGMYRVLVAEMSAGIREVTVERGLDPRDMPLLVGGGAGALHGAAVAQELGIATVVIPPAAATMSALGMLMTEFVHDTVRAHAVDVAGGGEVAELSRVLDALAWQAREEIVDQGVRPDTVRVRSSLDLRYRGQFHRVTVGLADGPLTLEVVHEALHAEHERRYGYSMRGSAVEVINVRARARGSAGGGGSTRAPRLAPAPGRAGARERRVYLSGAQAWVPVRVLGASEAADAPVPGPALVELAATTALVPPDWEAFSDPRVGLVLRRRTTIEPGDVIDPDERLGET